MPENMFNSALTRALPSTQVNTDSFWTSDIIRGKGATLLRLAAQLEKAQPWFDKRPAVFA